MRKLQWVAVPFVFFPLAAFLYSSAYQPDKVTEYITIMDEGVYIPYTPQGVGKILLYYYDIKLQNGDIEKVYSEKRNSISNGPVTLEKHFSLFQWKYVYSLPHRDY